MEESSTMKFKAFFVTCVIVEALCLHGVKGLSKFCNVLKTTKCTSPCSDNGDCDEDELCCRYSCGKSCIRRPRTLCTNNCLECGKYGCASCRAGFYGEGCTNKCSAGCKHDECELNTGACVHGCIDGYIGLYCDNHCSVECESCLGVSNNCTSCSHGFYGPDCDSTCSDLGCAFTNENATDCNFRCAGHECDPLSGICRNGCQSGFYGDKCQKKCDKSCRNGICEQATGACPGTCDTVPASGPCLEVAANVTVSGHGETTGNGAVIAGLLVVAGLIVIGVVIAVVVLTLNHRRKKKNSKQIHVIDPGSDYVNTIPAAREAHLVYEDMRRTEGQDPTYSQLGQDGKDIHMYDYVQADENLRRQ